MTANTDLVETFGSKLESKALAVQFLNSLATAKRCVQRQPVID